MNTDQFWAFMHERETIRRRRLTGRPMKDWTEDPIFRQFSFTNVKRLHDRTTMLLKREFYDRHRPMEHPNEVALLNSALFRFHGTIDTARMLGWSITFDEDRKKEVVSMVTNAMLIGKRCFTSAYMIPNCGDIRPKAEIVGDIVDGIWDHRELILDNDTWKEATAQLKYCWGVGSFMAKEILLDYMLCTGWIPNDWETWTPVGPGARRGAGVILNGIVKGVSETEALIVCKEIYAERAEKWQFLDLPLDLTDIQFQLCEFAKYMKVKFGVGKPKRRFSPTIDDVTKAV